MTLLRPAPITDDRPQIEEIIDFLDREAYRRESLARVLKKNCGQDMDERFNRDLVVLTAMLRFMRLVQQNEKAVASALRGKK